MTPFQSCACEVERGNGWQGCAERPQAATVYYDRWGAIATDESKGAFGAAEWSNRKDRAENKAIKECIKMGGISCTIKLIYKNECVSVVTGTRLNYFQSHVSDKVAVADGLRRCQEGDSGCKVYYVGCSSARRGI